jgi:NADH-quinone oxidoreductase subunit G
MDCRTDGSDFDVKTRAGYVFNSTITGIDQADAILLVGANPRMEATLVNARIYRNWSERKIRVGVIGEAADLTYKYTHLGASPQDMEKAQGFFAGAQKPMIIVGSGAFQRADGAALHHMLYQTAQKLGVVKDGWNGFNVLHTAASRVGALDVGFVPGQGGKNFTDIIAGTKDGSIKALYLLGADEFDAKSQIGWKTFVIYQGHHGDHGAARADVILPGAAYTEKDGIYVNTEGRPQAGKRASFPPGEAREDWKVLRALSEIIGKKLPYDTFSHLRERVFKEWPHLANFDVIKPAAWAEFGSKGKVEGGAFVSPVKKYYLKNAICRASKIMHECVQEFVMDELPKAAE